MESSIKQILQRMGQVPMKDGRAAKVHLCAMIWKNAVAGDKTYVKILLDRLEGRPTVAVPEPVKAETDEMLADALLRIYGPITEEEELSVAAEAAEMDRISKQVSS